eukprot:g47742.t1
MKHTPFTSGRGPVAVSDSCSTESWVRPSDDKILKPCHLLAIVIHEDFTDVELGSFETALKRVPVFTTGVVWYLSCTHQKSVGLLGNFVVGLQCKLQSRGFSIFNCGSCDMLQFTCH